MQILANLAHNHLMSRIKLQKLLAKPELTSLINNLINELKTSILITDIEGNILFGKSNNSLTNRDPIQIKEEIIGWLYRDEKGQSLASILSCIAHQEFEKKELASDALEKYEEIHFLYDISAQFSTCLTSGEIIEIIINETQKIFDFSDISVMLLDRQGELEIVSYQSSHLVKTKGTVQGIAGHVLRSGKAEIVNNVSLDPRYTFQENEIRCLICTPLTVQNRTIGVVQISHIHSINYSAEDLKLLTALTTQAAAAIQTAQYYEKLKNYSQILEQEVTERTEDLEKSNKKLQEANEKLKYLATVDELTKLYNRRYFNDYLNREWRRLVRERRFLSLIMCDIDYFHFYNLAYTHIGGDFCLQTVAQTMQQVVRRPADLVARYGGEEFVIILSDTNSLGAVKVAQSLRKHIEQLKIPHQGSKCSSYVTLSLGVATTIPTIEVSPEALIKVADEALYQAKDKGRNRYCVREFRPKQI